MRTILSVLIMATCLIGNTGTNEDLATVWLHEKDGDHKRAAEVLEELIKKEESKEKQADYLMRLADCYLRAGKATKSVAIYRRILKDYPKQVQAQVAAMSRIKEGADHRKQHFTQRGSTQSKSAKALIARLKRLTLTKISAEEEPIDQLLDRIVTQALKTDKDKTPIQVILLHDRPVEDRKLRHVRVEKLGDIRLIEAVDGEVVIGTDPQPADEDDLGGFEDDDDDDDGFDFDDDDDDDDDDGEDKLPTVVMDFDNIPLFSAIWYISEACGFHMEVRGKYVIVLPFRCTTERLYLDAVKVPKGFKLSKSDGVLKRVDFSLPSGTGGNQAFMATGDGGRTLFSYNTRANNRKLRQLVTSLQLSLKNHVDLSLRLVSVKVSDKELPAFVKPAYLAKLPRADKKIIDSVNVSTASGTAVTLALRNHRRHQIALTPTVAADRKTVLMDLSWGFLAKDEAESVIQSKFSFRTDEGRVLQLGIENGNYLLAVISARIPAQSPEDLQALYYDESPVDVDEDGNMIIQFR